MNLTQSQCCCFSRRMSFDRDGLEMRWRSKYYFTTSKLRLFIAILFVQWPDSLIRGFWMDGVRIQGQVFKHFSFGIKIELCNNRSPTKTPNSDKVQRKQSLQDIRTRTKSDKLWWKLLDIYSSLYFSNFFYYALIFIWFVSGKSLWSYFIKVGNKTIRCFYLMNIDFSTNR